MKKLLHTIVLIILASQVPTQAQTYAEDAKKCSADFMANFEKYAAEGPQTFFKEMEKIPKCLIGLGFPDFHATSMDGTPYSLSDLKGKAVLLNFWFIACRPCVAEIPMLNELAEEYRGKDFVLLSFSTDTDEKLEKFREKNELNYPVFDNSGPLIRDTFLLEGAYPKNIFLSKDGHIVEYLLGSEMEAEKLAASKAHFKQIIERELAK